MVSTVEKNLKKGLDHIRSSVAFYEDGVSQALHYVETGEGDPHACVMSLASGAEAKTMLAWFDNKDLSKFKAHAYSAGRLEQIVYEMVPRANQFRSFLLLWPLLSDCKPLIDWYATTTFYSDDFLFDII